MRRAAALDVEVEWRIWLWVAVEGAPVQASGRHMGAGLLCTFVRLHKPWTEREGASVRWFGGLNEASFGRVLQGVSIPKLY